MSTAALKQDIDAIELQMDGLIRILNDTTKRLDTLAHTLEEKRIDLAFESTEYTHPRESNPVKFFAIFDVEPATAEAMR